MVCFGSKRVASKKIVYFWATGFIKTLIETGESNETEMILKEKRGSSNMIVFVQKEQWISLTGWYTKEDHP